jgi:hypothetical protein
VIEGDLEGPMLGRPPFRRGKTGGEVELLQAGKKSLQFLFALPNCFGTRNIINV